MGFAGALVTFTGALVAAAVGGRDSVGAAVDAAALSFGAAYVGLATALIAGVTGLRPQPARSRESASSAWYVIFLIRRPSSKIRSRA